MDTEKTEVVVEETASATERTEAAPQRAPQRQNRNRRKADH